MLDLGDVQGIIRRGYGDMHHACFVLLRVQDVAAAKAWLGDVIGQITSGEEKPPDGRLNIAFTYAGLEVLGLAREDLAAFSREFREGMTTEHRSRILGDYGTSAPEKWEWGGPNNPAVHIVLLLYAPSEARLAAQRESLRAAFRAGCAEITTLATIRLKDRKEHFGFRDGISQPEIAEFERDGAPNNTVPAGEFLLGWPNESRRFAEGPRVFGHNGSYLVFRQLAQHVEEFWRFVADASRHSQGATPVEAGVKLAAKMVGRWPSGAPLVRYPSHDPDYGKREPDLPSDRENDAFGYHDVDAYGDRCPIGSHIRRSNPRDSLDPGPRISTRNSNRHRILRRGRAYGAPIAPSMEPADILAAEEADRGERGLHFLCFNADLAQQFEFVQQNWINNPKFEGLTYSAADPISGAHDVDHPEYTGTFTVQSFPVRQRVTGVPRFVDVRGGAYFFMPGIRALKYVITEGSLLPA